MQLAAYSLLAERATGLAARRGFIYRIPDSRLFVISMGKTERDEVLAAVSNIRSMCTTQELPDATGVRGRCVECEYQNYCADIW